MVDRRPSGDVGSKRGQNTLFHKRDYITASLGPCGGPYGGLFGVRGIIPRPGTGPKPSECQDCHITKEAVRMEILFAKGERDSVTTDEMGFGKNERRRECAMAAAMIVGVLPSGPVRLEDTAGALDGPDHGQGIRPSRSVPPCSGRSRVAENMEPVIVHPEQDKQARQKLAPWRSEFGKKPNILIFLMDDVGWMDPVSTGEGKPSAIRPRTWIDWPSRTRSSLRPIRRQLHANAGPRSIGPESPASWLAAAADVRQARRSGRHDHGGHGSPEAGLRHPGRGKVAHGRERGLAASRTSATMISTAFSASPTCTAEWPTCTSTRRSR